MEPNKGTTSLEPAEIIDRRDGVGGDLGKKEECSEGGKDLGERVRIEVRNRLGNYGDELFDEDDSADVEILQQEEIRRGSRGLGVLWKLSLYATLSFAAYVLFGKPRIEPNWIPNFTERDPIPKIYRPGHRR